MCFYTDKFYKENFKIWDLKYEVIYKCFLIIIMVGSWTPLGKFWDLRFEAFMLYIVCIWDLKHKVLNICNSQIL